jgi:two-component system CheB/CheR fusion protein
MAKQELRLELRTAIYQAKQQKVPVSREGLKIRQGDQIRRVKFDVIPFRPKDSQESYFLVLFTDAQTFVNPAMAVLNVNSIIDQDVGDSTESERPSQLEQQEKAIYEQGIAQLNHELASTRSYLQSIIEEQQATNQDLRAANEEILSSNEELQSTNEELETAKEEIQSTNEELNTINDELQRRNLESAQVSNDLQNLLSSINIPILMLGSNLQIRRYTPVAERIFNLIPTDIGRPLTNINHKLNVPNLEAQILEVISTLHLKTQEVQDQDGHWYDMRIRPYRTIDHKIDGAVVVLVDIDDLKLSSEQLKASRDYAAAIVSTVRESLVVLDRELRVVSANEFFYEAFRLSPEQTENQLIYQIGNGEWDIPQLRSLLAEVLTLQPQYQSFEVEQTFDGVGVKFIRFKARMMQQVDDKHLILLVIEDITQEKQLEAERHLLAQEQSARSTAEAANHAKDQFLSILSHELRNPLNSLLGWVKLLRTQKMTEAKNNQALEAIERSAKAQNQLIGELLDVSRISIGKMRLDIQQVELISVIEAAIEVVRLSAEAKQIQIESTLDPLPKVLIGDAIRLQQVVWNLLSNSIKFTPIGGRIEVSLRYDDRYGEIRVKDSGLGISADCIPMIFDRFHQVDHSKSKSNPGLGLGLSIVRHLVELHGGTVAAESPGEGEGATFIVRLPLQNDSMKPEPRPAIAPIDLNSANNSIPENYASLVGIRVLLVDDESDIRHLFRIILEGYGVEVSEAESTKTALSLLMAHPGEYDLLLSDIGLPQEDGYALIRQVRSLSPEAGGQIPAAALTAYAGTTEAAEALTAGFQVHLAKPITPDQLVSVVASLVNR